MCFLTLWAQGAYSDSSHLVRVSESHVPLGHEEPQSRATVGVARFDPDLSRSRAPPVKSYTDNMGQDTTIYKIHSGYPLALCNANCGVL